MDYHILSLIIELLLDSTVMGLGTLLIIKSRDNRYKRIWGLLTIVVAVATLIDNIYWLDEISDFGATSYKYANILTPDMLIRFYLFTQCFSLFVLGSFKPGWMTGMRIVTFSQPLIIISVALFCNWWFGGDQTQLTSVRDILTHLGNTDVQLRVATFLISMANPLVNLAIPLFWKKAPLRKPSKGTYIYISAIIANGVIYIMFSLNLTESIFFVFDYITMGILAGLTLLYMRDENPFSLPPSSPESDSGELNNSENLVSPVIYLLHQRMVDYILAHTPFTDPDYTLGQLAQGLNTNQTLITQAIKFGGYSSFREYINILRIKYFKSTASTMPGTSIKELMYRCGFTSRSSFYRHFSEQESISPKRYLENLYQTEGRAPVQIDDEE